jgi:hypothetical protein
MYVPPGGGPSPHRHDFEEMFDFTFGGEGSVARAPRSTARNCCGPERTRGPGYPDDARSEAPRPGVARALSPAMLAGDAAAS